MEQSAKLYQRQTGWKPYIAGSRSALLFETRAGKKNGWNAKRARSVADCLKEPVQIAVAEDAKVAARLSERYAKDANALCEALNRYFHSADDEPMAYSIVRKTALHAACATFAGILNQLGEDADAGSFPTECADETVQGIRKRLLAALIDSIRHYEKRSKDAPEDVGEAVRRMLAQQTEHAEHMAADEGSRIVCAASVRVADECGYTAKWSTHTGECAMCRRLDGVVIGKDSRLKIQPPLHNGCACSVELQKNDLQTTEKSDIISVDAQKVVAEAKLKDGRHHGKYVDAQKWSTKSVERAIKSSQKTIDEHYEKIAHPEKVCSDWDSYADFQKEALIGKWQKDISRNTELREIYKEILAERDIV